MLKSVMHVESILKKSVETIKNMLKFLACSENCNACCVFKISAHVENCNACSKLC